jgi:3-oxoacyl-[acyl-carrier protein] reductase
VELTGDNNPIHVDEQYAAGIGVGGRIVHGMLTVSYLSTVIGTVLPGPGALILSQKLSFRSPVRVDDTIRVGVRVRQISPATRVLVLDVDVQNQRGSVVADGQVQVLVLEGSHEMTDDRKSVDTVVVTGSSRGIGASIAKRLATDGCRVVVNFRRDKDRAEETVNSIIEAGGQATSFGADISRADEVAALMAHAVEKFGPVDALVNNAGAPTDPRPLSQTTWADMEIHLNTNLRGSFLCVQETLPGMIERGFGRIVNVTSQAAYGTPPWPKSTGYVVAKAALAAFTRCLALEAGPRGVTVNAVAPGMTETDMVADISQRAKMSVAAQAPLRRLVRVAEIADVVSFLMGAGASSVTGQTIHLDGGQYMP